MSTQYKNKFHFKTLFIIGFVFIIFSCNREPWENENLKGLTEKKVDIILGTSDASRIIVLSDKLYEYQYGLLAIFPNYKEKHIEIKEKIWGRKNKKTAVWFFQKDGDWIEIDNMTWNENFTKF
jgi:hypothetical protein